MNLTDRKALLQQLQAEDFALYEVALYLDAHPQNKKALRFYEEHKKIAAMLREAINSAAPLTVYDNQNTEKWQWVDGPWPWEKEAN